MRTLELKIPPVVIVLLQGALMYAIARLAPLSGFVLPAGRIIAASLAMAGLIIAILGVVSFRRAKTTVNPLQPREASTLVVSGIYRWTRNPMYLGMLLVLLGWAAALAHALVWVFPVLFVPLMNNLQIRPEERALAARFGPDFAVYQSKVRRWL